jgi:hypothetical protein
MQLWICSDFFDVEVGFFVKSNTKIAAIPALKDKIVRHFLSFLE